jgi:uncharacterized protein
MMLLEFALPIFLILFFAALAAGYMDTLAGGGGLITLPALMLCGLPITTALGTNKLQSSFGSVTASLVLFGKQKIILAKILKPLIFALMGGFVGAISVLWMDKSALKWLVATALILVVIYFVFSKKVISESPVSSIKIGFHTYIAVPLIGFYDGLLGPGTGSFFTAINLHFRGFDFHSATAYAKPLNAATNLAALTVFIFNDAVNWLAGLAMILGQIAGSWLAAHKLHHYSQEFLRKLVISVSLILLVSYVIRELI